MKVLNMHKSLHCGSDKSITAYIETNNEYKRFYIISFDERTSSYLVNSANEDFSEFSFFADGSALSFEESLGAAALKISGAECAPKVEFDFN